MVREAQHIITIIIIIIIIITNRRAAYTLLGKVLDWVGGWVVQAPV